MAKQIKPQTVLGLFNAGGKLHTVCGNTDNRADFLQFYFKGQWPKFQEVGWRCVRVRVEVVKPKKRSRR